MNRQLCPYEGGRVSTARVGALARTADTGVHAEASRGGHRPTVQLAGVGRDQTDCGARIRASQDVLLPVQSDQSGLNTTFGNL